MKTIVLFLILAATARAGDTYDCINAKSDYYAPRQVHTEQIVIAVDSARCEPRWQPMLDPNDLRDLIFLQAQRTRIDVLKIDR